ncbi:hypothetical protein LP43_1327 [Methylophaga thiooxydans]|uniref:Uncharacterized protein n=1 Tax=Methylophaga thiooxydans TaxID=392484 RepID=A0A0A0BG53_9GAMM|nr:hypothetical protein [Methylophaga thiooxydans]KGM06835.1 hypothetical protein LP43_1327 [Methylophaga thiooxydans]
MNNTHYRFLTLFFVLQIVACVPSVSKIYNGPEVTGTILRLSDLTPVANARISYGSSNSSSSDSPFTESNDQGQFTLIPIAKTKLEMRMPAHMLTHTVIYTHHANYGTSADVVQSLWMNREYEKVDVGTIILDDNPTEYTFPLVENGVDIKLLRNSLQTQNLLGQCNYDEASGAINKLNVVRKLASHIAQAKSEGTEPNMASAYLQTMKEGTQDIWAHLIANCNNGKPSDELKKLKSQVVAELVTDTL